MTSINAPDIASFTRLSRIVSDVKARADIARTESVTGQRQDVTAATGGDVGGAHLLKKALEDAQAYQQSLKLAQIRAERTQTSLAAVSGDAVRIATEVLIANGREDEYALQTQAADARATVYNIFGVLNVTEGGRALFSGDAADRLPLGDPDQFLADVEAIIAGATDAADAEAQLDFYFNDPAGGFLTNIYLGGSNKIAPVETSPGVRVDVSATAADQPIKDLLKGLVGIIFHDTAAFADASAFLESSAASTLTADADLIQLRGVIGVGEAQIEAAKARYESEESVLSRLLNEKIGRDQYDAASELQLLETQLEASFLLSARLSRLSIANYLR